MELCDNSLQNILNERKEGFKCEQIFNIMSQLNNTLKIMYKKKIIHRDIKLDNILVKYKDNNNNDSNVNFIVKLTDYGISKQLKNTINTTYLGTIETMAPEVLEGEENYDNKCDLWSIGIIIYQLYFKEYPYKGNTQVAIYKQIEKLGKKVLKKTKNEKLDNLIKALLIRETEKRIDYEEYFNHPFFKENHVNNNSIYNNNNNNNLNKNECNNSNYNTNNTIQTKRKISFYGLQKKIYKLYKLYFK